MKALEKNIAAKLKLRPFVAATGIPLFVTILLYLWRLNEVTPLQLLIAFLLLLLPWQDYRGWRRGGKPALPVFAVLAFMYWLYYVVPFFLEDHVFATIYEPMGHELTSDTITLALLMALIGVCALWLGMRLGSARFVVPRVRLSLELKNSKLHYVRAVLIVGSLLSLSDTPVRLVGEGSRQLVGIMVSFVPILAFAILFRTHIRKQSTFFDRVLVFGFLGIRLVGGLSSGWLGVTASILVVCGAIYLLEHRQMPRLAVLGVVLFTVFFQFGKEDFRKTYWQGGEVAQVEQGSRTERVKFWIDSSLDKWNDVLNDPNALRRAISPSVSRLSLLNQTANVIDLTPSVVPYQYGWLYSYMAITWIPRFVWPDKPSMSEANQYYQVAYGLSSEEDLSRVSISVGILAEGFMNFGWVGAAGIMFLAGVFFDFFQRTFLASTSGALMTAIGVILIPQFLSVESQMAQYLGGIVQQVVVTLIVMLPIISVRDIRRRRVSQSLRTIDQNPLLAPK
ncbi:MAG TPA: hypothetical protein VKC61_06170 [Pyrinomonadaceae bacterium]|nr:hypothetical protein [Pyrinomonadaceae bacterium]